MLNRRSAHQSKAMEAERNEKFEERIGIIIGEDTENCT